MNMKKKFLNIGLLLTMSLMVVFTSCDNEPERPRITITAKNVVGNTSDIAVVKAGMWSWNEFSSEFLVINEVPFQNNGFTMELPRTLSAGYLRPISIFLIEDLNISKMVYASSRWI